LPLIDSFQKLQDKVHLNARARGTHLGARARGNQSPQAISCYSKNVEKPAEKPIAGCTESIDNPETHL